MKIKKEHFEHIKNEIEKFIASKPDFQDIKKSFRDAGRSDMRFRWDVFTAAGLNKYACDTLYKYLNDDHIDTALKNIITP